MTKPLTALIIDDHAVVRAGCRLLLRQRNWEILEATTGKDGLELNLRQQPELIVLDLGLPDAGGLDILKKLVLDNAQTRVLVFTMHEDPVLAVRALEGGHTATSQRVTAQTASLRPWTRSYEAATI